MQINTNGKRNITLDFDAPKKFKLRKDGAEIPYIRTGKNSFRLGRNIDGVLDLEEVIEQPRIVKPMQLQAQQMALVNPNDVLMINQAAQQLEVEQNLLNETQKRVEQTQAYLDVQQQRINEAVLSVQGLETDNSERITATENGIFNLAGELAKAEGNSADADNYIISELDEHKTAENPHGITKETIGLNKVDNTSDLDKPISKAVQSALDEKADKDEIQAIRDELGEYQEKNDRFTNALSNYTGGLAGNQLPDGGLEGQILAKRSDMSGDAEWIDSSVSITVDDELSLTSENPVQNKVITSSVNSLQTSKQDVISDLATIRSGAELGATAVQPSALNGYATQTWVGQQGYITGITSSDVTSALGYTPYDSENPDGYITSADLPTNHVTTNTAQTISGDKKFTGVTRFQNGSGNGCVILGADVAQTTVSNYTRKLGRMSFHTYTNTLDCAFVSTDSDVAYNYVEFGGRNGDTTNTSPDILRFTVANSHNSKNSKTHALEISYSGGANFTVLPKYKTKNLATESYVTTAVSGKQDTLVSGTNIKTINNTSLLGSGNIDIQGGGGAYTAGDGIDITSNTISVKSSIINGAELGTTSLQVGDNISDLNNDSGFITSSALTPYVLSADLASVATSGSYDDLINKPTIPTVNNPTITFTQDGTTKGTITLNQSTNQTVALDAGSGGSYTAGTGIDITNDVISVTNAISTGAALGATALQPSALNGYATETWVGQQGYITSSALNGYATESYVDNGLDGKVDKNDLAPVHCVVETYVNGTSWYRVYDDGWCEQAGEITIQAQGANTGLGTKVTFLKPYINTNYYVAPITYITDGGNTIGLRNNHTDKNTTSMNISTYSTVAISNSYRVAWYTCGYIS